jgi:hypothetical protein
MDAEDRIEDLVQKHLVADRCECRDGLLRWRAGRAGGRPPAQRLLARAIALHGGDAGQNNIAITATARADDLRHGGGAS